MAGILGAVAQLLIIGVTQPTIDNAYCDCGFKETEIVAQIWGQQLAESASQWLINAALVLSAIGVASAGTAFRDRMPSSWNVYSWLVAIGLVAAVVIPFLRINPDLDLHVLAGVAGLMVPIWALWLGTSSGPMTLRPQGRRSRRRTRAIEIRLRVSLEGPLRPARAPGALQ